MAKGKGHKTEEEDTGKDMSKEAPDTFDVACGLFLTELEKEQKSGTLGAKIKASEHGAEFNPIVFLPFVIGFVEWLRKFRKDNAA